MSSVSAPRTPTNTTEHRLSAVSNPVFMKLCELRRKGYGWEDIIVLMRADGYRLNANEVRRYVLDRPKARSPAGAGGALSSCAKAAGT
jgi:hypothetical protein